MTRSERNIPITDYRATSEPNDAQYHRVLRPDKTLCGRQIGLGWHLDLDEGTRRECPRCRRAYDRLTT